MDWCFNSGFLNDRDRCIPIIRLLSASGDCATPSRTTDRAPGSKSTRVRAIPVGKAASMPVRSRVHECRRASSSADMAFRFVISCCRSWTAI